MYLIYIHSNGQIGAVCCSMSCSAVGGLDTPSFYTLFRYSQAVDLLSTRSLNAHLARALWLNLWNKNQIVDHINIYIALTPLRENYTDITILRK